MERYDVAIVGGGASGLACAAVLSEQPSLKIAVIEAGARAGKKLAATGNGQGNIGNMNMSRSCYRSGDLSLVGKIIGEEGAKPADWACRRIFGEMLYRIDGSGRIYPFSMQASSLTDILLRRLGRRGVDILLETRVSDISEGFVLSCGARQISARYAVLAAGGKAQKQFLTDGSAYSLACKFGHKLTPLYPAIVQLRTDTRYIKGLKGVRANCLVRAYGKDGAQKQTAADVIFTDYGISGNAAFYLSSILAAGGGAVSIDFLPGVGQEELENILYSRLGEGTELRDVLCGIVHNAVARAILGRVGESDVKKIASAAKNFTLEVTGTLGFDYAQVTQGGIDMRGVTGDLESRLCKRLYLAGEILDVDGDCGGYNLHWAFSSGITVAEAILKDYEKA